MLPSWPETSLAQALITFRSIQILDTTSSLTSSCKSMRIEIIHGRRVGALSKLTVIALTRDCGPAASYDISADSCPRAQQSWSRLILSIHLIFMEWNREGHNLEDAKIAFGPWRCLSCVTTRGIGLRPFQTVCIHLWATSHFTMEILKSMLLLVIVCSITWWTLKGLVSQFILLSRIPGPKGHVISGHLRHLLQRDYHRTLACWSEVYGQIFRINILGVQGLVISDPKVIASLLGQDRGVNAVPKLRAYQELDMVRLYVFIMLSLVAQAVRVRQMLMSTS